MQEDENLKNGYYDIKGEAAAQIGSLLNVYDSYAATTGFYHTNPAHLAELRINDAGYKLDAHAKDYFVTADIGYDGTIVFKEIDCVNGVVNIICLNQNGLTIAQDQWNTTSGIVNRPQIVKQNPENAVSMEKSLREGLEAALQIALGCAKKVKR